MPRRSSVATLPAEVRRWLERALEENGFAGYEQLVALLKAKGYEISKSSLHRWGKDIQDQRAIIYAEAQNSQALSEGGADARDTRSEAIFAVAQTMLIRKLREAMLSQAEGKDDDPTGTAMALARIGRDIATMARGSMDLKRFQAAIEEAARKRLIEAQRAKLDELGKTGAVAPDVLAKVIKAAYDL
ncbi:MAG TPA: DUF3486 family protein [Burkholderiaceae bacterium]|jgi:hypothetical protein|nr:DUF3486 family protein [Burkholderiaceae bacterium]